MPDLLHSTSLSSIDTVSCRFKHKEYVASSSRPFVPLLAILGLIGKAACPQRVDLNIDTASFVVPFHMPTAVSKSAVRSGERKGLYQSFVSRLCGPPTWPIEIPTFPLTSTGGARRRNPPRGEGGIHLPEEAGRNPPRHGRHSAEDLGACSKAGRRGGGFEVDLFSRSSHTHKTPPGVNGNDSRTHVKSSVVDDTDMSHEIEVPCLSSSDSVETTGRHRDGSKKNLQVSVFFPWKRQRFGLCARLDRSNGNSRRKSCFTLLCCIVVALM